jgi:hypothetical protein
MAADYGCREKTAWGRGPGDAGQLDAFRIVSTKQQLHCALLPYFEQLQLARYGYSDMPYLPCYLS